MRPLERRVAALEAVRGPAMRVSAAEQARVQAELQRLRPGVDLAGLVHDLAPARIAEVDLDVLRIVAGCQLDDYH